MEFVAEISGNHQGKKELALELIESAAWAGATAVKFQMFDPKRLAEKRFANPAMKREDIQNKWKVNSVEALTKLYTETRTPTNWFIDLALKAKSCGIDWWASVFSAEDAHELADYGCRTMKISAFEFNDFNVLIPARYEAERMILSVPPKTPDKTIEAVLRTVRGPPVTLLHATGYGEAADLKELERLKKFGVDIGLSDHTTDISAAIAATNMGAKMIEAHLKLEGDDISPDSSFSCTPERFKAMVTLCNEIEEAKDPVESSELDWPVEH